MNKWIMSRINHDTDVLKYYFRIKDWEYKYQFYIDMDHDHYDEIDKKLSQFLPNISQEKYRLYRESGDVQPFRNTWLGTFYFGTNDTELATLFKLTWC